MRHHALAVLTILLMFSLQAHGAQDPKDKEWPNAIVRVKVVDDDGRPVRDAHSTLWSLSDMDGTFGRTNRRGIYSQQLKRIRPPVGGEFYKEGYYKSIGDIWKREGDERFPTNTITVTLKRIIDPVPMQYYKRTAFFLPRHDKPVGFDFEVGDWIDPDGKGKVADVWIVGRAIEISDRDYEYRVSLVVSNKLDGFKTVFVRGPDNFAMSSALLPPQKAPESGYQSELELYKAWAPGKEFQDSSRKDCLHLFRLRTKVDETGKPVEAHVGWLKGETSIGIGKKGLLGMSLYYYWNPDPTSRSLEPKEIAERQGLD